MDMLSALRFGACLVGIFAIAAIAFFTLSPIERRPVVASLGLEHVTAFAITSLLFGIAYPEGSVLVLACLIVVIVGLELAQNIVPSRHGQIQHAIMKIGGAASGVGASYLISSASALPSFDRLVHQSN